MQKLEFTQASHTQITFSESKYIDLAGSNATGLRLRRVVEDRWFEWVDKVASAPWLRNWKRSQVFGCPGCTPWGHMVTTDMIEKFERDNSFMFYNSPHKLVECSGLAIVLFSSAVWGFGVDGWLRNSILSCDPYESSNQRGVYVETVGVVAGAEAGAGAGVANGDIGKARGSKFRLKPAMSKVLELQCVKKPNAARTYFWDNVFYCGHSVSLPCEYCDLDVWLEQLYQEIL